MRYPTVLTGNAAKIYAYLRDHGPTYAWDLSRKLGISTGRCSVTLRQLESDRLLVAEMRPGEIGNNGSPRRYFSLADPYANVIAEPSTGPSPKARKPNKGRRLTLKGISENYDAEGIEALVRAAAEIVGGRLDWGGLSERQVELAKDAYRRLMAETGDGTDGPDVNGSEDDQSFYAALRDHAHDYGVQVTWTAVHARFRSGKLVMRERKLLAFLGTLLRGHRAFDPASGPDAGWSIVTGVTGGLADQELFSVDDGWTWHVCWKPQPWDKVVSCYYGAARGDDARVYRLDADPDGECLVVRRT